MTLIADVMLAFVIVAVIVRWLFNLLKVQEDMKNQGYRK